jgi:hypothetical protein
MKLKNGLILLAFIAIAFTACKDDEETTTPSKTKMELLTSGSWIPTNLLLNDTSFWDIMPACSKDDFFTFKSDGTYITDEGATKCDPMDPQTSTANWSFNANQTKVTIDGDEGDIAELTETVLRVRMMDSTDVIEIRYRKK